MTGIRERLSSLSHSRLALLALELHERLEAQAAQAAQVQPYIPIAVVGMACRFPGHVTDAKSYWKLLQQRADAIREVPKDRWDVDAIYDPDPEAVGKTYCRHGGFLDAVDTFDAEFFGLSPREAISMDPQQRLLLEVAWEALEDAGLAADRLAGSNTGVFIGAGANDYSRLLSDPATVDGYALTGNALNALAGRISFVLGLRGPSLVVDTACSSSLVAVHLAALSLRCGESRVALAGGVNLMLVPYPSVVTSRLRMLAPDGRCKAFDAAADGFVRSEGCGVVVLKRLEDAKQDGDRIFAVLKSSAVNQDGASSGFTVPNVLAQKALLQDALRLAGLTPEQVHYVEAHGTGTSLGDPIEMQALHEVFGNGVLGNGMSGNASERPLFVGSVKSNIGHLESAAGIAGFIKAVLALQHREIPGQLHFHQPTPLFDWNRSRLRVTPQTLPWPDQGRGVACVSSFGVSGTNAHVILEEADPPATSRADQDDDIHLLAISAKSTNALRTLAARYAEQLADGPALDFADFCYTVNVGRAQLPIRAAAAGTKKQIQSRLAKLAAGDTSQSNISRVQETRVAFLFSGRGIPSPGAGRELYEAIPAFREALDRCDEAFRPELIRPLPELLFDTRGAGAVNEWRKRADLSHSVAFALQYAFAELWRSWGIVPASVCGFGPGEVVAACVAGCLSLTDALSLILQRGQPIRALPPVLGWMSSVTGTWVTAAPDAEYWSRQSREPARLDSALEQLRQEGHNVFIEMAGWALPQQSGELHPLPASPAVPLTRGTMGECPPREGDSASGGVAAIAGGRSSRTVEAKAICHLVSTLTDGHAVRSMLDALSQAFVAGCTPRFESLPSAASRRKISVPFYAFERRRYWLEPSTAAPQRSSPNLLYGLEWRKQDLTTADHHDAQWTLKSTPDTQCIELMLREDGVERTAGMVFLAGRTPESAHRTTSDCARFLEVLQKAVREPARLALVTRGAWQVEETDVADPAQAALWGMGRVLLSEHPDLHVTLLDLPAFANRQEVEDVLLHELTGATVREQAAYRQGVRYVARLANWTMSGNAPALRLDSQGTYLVTGGKGGLGRRLVEWLAEHGAGRIVILTRQSPSVECQHEYSVLAAQGHIIEIELADVSIADDVARAMARCGANLKGIFHLAGVLDDGVLAQQTANRFERVMAPKAWGAWNLHQQSLKQGLDFFVLFSSASALLGTPGQGNYAAANAFLDSLAQMRRGMGLCAHSIQYGPWAGIGMSAHRQESGVTDPLPPALRAAAVPLTRGTMGDSDRPPREVAAAAPHKGTMGDSDCPPREVAADVPHKGTMGDSDCPPREGDSASVASAGGRASAGIEPLEPRIALAALEHVLQAQTATPQMVLAAEWANLRRMGSTRLPLLEDQLPRIQRERSLLEDVRGLTAPDARAFLRREVALAAARVLRRDKPIGGSDGFFDAGMDSLMALELRNILQSRLGLEDERSECKRDSAQPSRTALPTSLLFDYPCPDQLGDHLAETLGVAARSRPSASTTPSRNGGPLAIVGMGCRFPGGIVSPETYWEALCRGIVAITEIPHDRWDADAFYDPDPDAPGKMVSRRGGFLDHIDQFDAGFFGIAPREAIHMDPQQRILLEVAWETMENAGIATDRLTDKSVGVFVGISSNDYLHRLGSAVQRGDAYLGVGNALSAAAGRLSYVMGWNGPSMAIDTACSSSLVAVHLACQALRDQRCRMAVAGGVNAVLSPESNVQLSKAHMLAPDGLCKVFDSAADGYVRGEGCGLIVLKRLNDAVADGDRIWAVIRGTAVNQDGRAAGLTVPSGPAQVAVIQEALADAGLEPADVQYVEAHGTGTSLGDPIELDALAAAYAGQRRRQDDLLIGSVKANLGHLESAAGIAGLMKAVLVLSHGKVPPQPHFHRPTPHIDWEQSRLRVPVVQSHLPAGTSAGTPQRRAAVSSFGFIGTNAHVILEQAPVTLSEPVEASHPFHVLTLSARTAGALEMLRQQYAAAISAGVSLEDICFTANTGRARFSHRMALVAAHSGDALAQLSDGQGLLRGTIDPDTPARLALWFPEHSVTLHELKSHWLWSSSAFQAAWRTCAPGITESVAEDADPRLLGYVLSCTLAEMWRSWGIEPTVVAGRGLGEIAAECFGGGLSAAEGLEQAQSLIQDEGPVPRMRIENWELGIENFRIRQFSILNSQFSSEGAASPIEALAAAGCRLVLSMGVDSSSLAWSESGLQMLTVWRVTDAVPLFHALAELFVAGVGVDWARVSAQDGGRKISMSTYPFQRQRFWPAEASPARSQAAPAAPARLPEHPLLGQRFHSPALTEIVFQSHVSTDSPALVQDHQVYEKPILSGPTQLSMLMDAARNVFPEGTYVASDVTFLKPNILTGADGRTMQVILKLSGDRAAFRVVSVVRGREEYEAEWVVHSTGQLRCEAAGTKRVELDNLRRRYEEERHMPGDALYGGLKQVGVTLGPSYRWIDEMRYVRGSSLAKMRGGTPQDLVYRIHPGLADSCFQTMAGATGFDDVFVERGEASVPALVSELRMFHSCERASWCHASVQFDHGHAGMTVGGWRLFDEDGRVLVEANGVYLQRAPRESLFRALADRPAVVREPERPAVDWRPETIETHVQQHVVAVLGLKSTEPPGPREKLFDLGLDSLMAMQLKERLEAEFGRALPATLLFDYPTTSALTQYLSSILVAAKPSTEEPDAPEPAAITDIAEIQGMSEAELDDVVRRELESLFKRSE